MFLAVVLLLLLLFPTSPHDRSVPSAWEHCLLMDEYCGSPWGLLLKMIGEKVGVWNSSESGDETFPFVLDGDDATTDGSEHVIGDIYKTIQRYYEEQPPTMDAVIGRMGFVNRRDIWASIFFLRRLFKMKNPPRKSRALDVGAGFGRVSMQLLIPMFDKVDLQEQAAHYVQAAKEFLGHSRKLGKVFHTAHQDFSPTPGAYDIIWCQWVVMYLLDKDVIQLFERLRRGLAQNGMIVLKENTLRSLLVVEKNTGAVARSLNRHLSLLERVGLRAVRFARQRHFPRGLLPIHMVALRPTN